MGNPRPRPRRFCNCDKCAGKEIPERTWYTHNPKESRRRPFQLPQEMIDVILRQPETNILPPWARKRKRQLGEEAGVEATPRTSKRALESESVCLCAYMRLESAILMELCI